MTQKLTLIPVMKVFADAVDLLRALPTKPSEIAALLAAEGVKGVPGSSQHCPLARYVKAHVEIPEGVTVHVGIQDLQLRFGGTSHHYLMSPPVQAFRRNFDYHEYPDLIGATVVPVAS